MPRTDHEKYQGLVIRTLNSAIFIQWIYNAIGFFTSYPGDSANTFEQPGPGARSEKCYRRKGLKPSCLQDFFFFSIGGQFSCFYDSFSCDGGGGAVRVEGGLSRITDCFLNGPKVFFVKNTANSVLSQISWRSSNICGSTTRQPDCFGTE